MLTNYHVLTNSGQNIITRSLVENKSIEFTSYKVGDGDVATIDEIKLLTDIKGNLIKKFGVAKTSKVSNSTTSVSGQYDNSDIVVATQVKEYALFAKLEGESSEVLFSYQGLGNGFILPSYTGTLLTQVVDFTITMTQDVGVVVRFNPSALVDMQTFFEELDKKVDKTSIKNEQLTNTVTDLLSSSASRNLFENGAGGKCLGYIEDGGQHTPHETNFWISKKVNGQFRCVVSNSDNYIDADKWLPIDDNSNASKLKNLKDFISLGQIPLGKTIVGENIFLSEEKDKFHFLCIRIGIGPFPNLNSGADCTDMLVPSQHTSYFYTPIMGDPQGNVYQAQINMDVSRVCRIHSGTLPNRGIIIFGICRK